MRVEGYGFRVEGTPPQSATLRAGLRVSGRGFWDQESERESERE